MATDAQENSVQVCIGYDAQRATLVWFADCDEKKDCYDVYTAVIERQGRGIIAAAPLLGIHKHELHDLLAVLDEESGERADRFVGELTLEAAARVLAQAAMQTRIAGRSVPQSVWRTQYLVGDIAAAMNLLEDVYSCPRCGDGLEGGSQLALADGSLVGPVQCDVCRGPSLATLRPYTRFVPLWIARAQLMLAGGLPRRAMVVAHQAEIAGASGPTLARIRGWAQLMLGNAIQAERHLSEAVRWEPEEPRSRLMLILAKAQASLAVDAVMHLPYLERAKGLGADLVEPLRHALHQLSRPGLGRPEAVAAACTQLLGVLESN